MRTLIIGASGLVGGALRAVFPDAVGTYFRTPAAEASPLDISRRGRRARPRRPASHPTLVLLPAAQPNVDRCETEPAESERVNVDGTRHVAEAAAATGARLVFFSTDYVFDGRAGPYAPDAADRRPSTSTAATSSRRRRIVRETVADHLDRPGLRRLRLPGRGQELRDGAWRGSPPPASACASRATNGGRRRSPRTSPRPCASSRSPAIAASCTRSVPTI